jgi:hypothetical protein
MGKFVFGPVSVTGVVDFAAWTRNLIDQLRALQASGDIRQIPSFEEMLVGYRKVLTAIDSAARNASGTRISQIEVPMSVPEHRHLEGVGRSIESYVGILATRGVVDFDMPPDVAEAFAALASGSYSADD